LHEPELDASAVDIGIAMCPNDVMNGAASGLSRYQEMMSTSAFIANHPMLVRELFRFDFAACSIEAFSTSGWRVGFGHLSFHGKWGQVDSTPRAHRDTGLVRIMRMQKSNSRISFSFLKPHWEAKACSLRP
jgi:hypothetical protein